VRPAKADGLTQERTPSSPILVGHFTKDDARCTVVYVKTALVENLPLDVLRYAESSSAFPHETTADQFFTEAQFEAYRRLGLMLAGEACNRLATLPEWRDVVGPSAGSGAPNGEHLTNVSVSPS
jgi:hypothetical protein